MSEELLSEIVAAERDIRRQISVLEEELAARLATVRAEAAEELQREAERLEEELAWELEQASRSARDEAKAVVAEADAYAGRIRCLEAGRLEGMIVRHLQSLREDKTNDRPDEQA